MVALSTLQLELSTQVHNNQQLFSDHNLNVNLPQDPRRRIQTDLDPEGRGLNQKLTAWWERDFPTLCAEVRRHLRHDIPVRERDDWEEWLTDQTAEHNRLTAEIIRLETDLNQRVYTIFDLTPANIQTIEDITKYPYGEV